MNTGKPIHFLGLAIALLSTLWLTLELVENRNVFLALSSQQIPPLLLAILVYSTSALISNLAWHRLLLSVGAESTSLVQTVGIGFVSQFAKYLPGNIIQHISRIALAKACGHTITNLLVTVFLETIWVMCVATIIAVPAILVLEGELVATLRQAHRWWVLLIVFFAAAIVPYIAQPAVRRLLQWWARNKGIEASSITVPSFRTISFVCSLYVLNFFLVGAVLSIVVSLFSNSEAIGLFTLTAVFAVAWVVGFITPGAPAGMGIRELVLVTFLSPAFGSELAIGIAATLRVITLVGDGLVFIEGGILYRLYIQPRASTS